MGVRRNVVTNPPARAAYVQGVLALKAEQSGPTTTQFGIPGPARKVSTYDLFVAWHHLAMMQMTPAAQTSRNAAHSGPAFAPWHRLMLLLFEAQIQRLLGDDTFALPYWDWAVDGNLPAAQQRTAPLWTAAGIGGSVLAPPDSPGEPVPDGPFTDPHFVRIASNATGQLVQTDRALLRNVAGGGISTLPTTDQVTSLLGQNAYDRSPWSRSSGKFRNRLEGWTPAGGRMHNRVHVFIGGDMGPASSPNDPVFFLNHCNVDRIWEAWMRDHGRVYVPSAAAPVALKGHRIGDQLYSILTTQPVLVEEMFDPAAHYSYDTLPT